MSLFDAPKKWRTEELRRAARMAHWKKLGMGTAAGPRRQDMQGLDAIDVETTRAILLDKAPKPFRLDAIGKGLPG